MAGFPSSSGQQGDPAFDDQRTGEGAPPVSLGRPAPPVSSRDRVTALLTRLPVSPSRLLIGVLAGIILLLLALWLFRPPPPAVETTLPRATATADGRSAGATASETSVAPTSVAPPTMVVVDAAGAVTRPGLYRLRPGSRVNDLVRIAGGLLPGADRNRLNLAAPLADGQRLYVPKAGEQSPPDPVDLTGGEGTGPDAGTSGSATPGGSAGQTPGPATPVDLNTATADELDTLPGVGPSTAAAILDYRTQHGPFRSVDDLLDVRGIGDAKLAALRSKVRV